MDGNIELFFSRAARASMAKCDRLHDAVLALAQIIESISDSPEHRADWIEDAIFLLKELVRDADHGEVA